MAIASMIVQPANDAVDRVIAELTGISGVTVHTTTPNNQIIVVVEAPSLDDVNFLAKTMELIPGVAGVFPTYVYTEDD